MNNYLTSYVKLDDFENETFSRSNDQRNSVQYVTAPEVGKKRWTHIKDLDDFLIKIYTYHQNDGFWSLLLDKIGHVITVLFTCAFTAFLWVGVDYEIVFKDKFPPGYNDTTPIKISDCIINVQDIEFSYILISFILMSCAYIVYAFYDLIKTYTSFSDIWYFYNEAMGIKDKDLANMTWQEVQDCLKKAQVEHRMCVYTEYLTELEIYQRILRFENYFVAMVHKNVISLKLNLPLLGEFAFLSRGFKFILKYLLFDCSFENGVIKNKYKHLENRRKLAKLLHKRFFWYGLFGLVISPVVLIMQIFESVYRYTSFIKVNPTIFTIRMWSNYGKVATRHYNELDHEQQIRLSRGYKFANEYMRSFRFNFVAKITKPLSYITGGISAYMMLLGIYDEDVVQIQHFFTLSLVLLFVTLGLISTLPNENFSTPPEILMTQIFSEIHYLSSSWEGKAHTSRVRNEFSNYFQYTFSHLLEALVSPIVTPLILMFITKAKCLEIIDFLRNFSIVVPGMGDVCYYALMKIERPGSYTSHPVNIIESSPRLIYSPLNAVDNGKTEKSLINFNFNNPRWEPPQCSSAFLNNVKKQSFMHFEKQSPVIQTAMYNSHISRIEESSNGIALPMFPSSSGSSSYRDTRVNEFVLKDNKNLNELQERTTYNMRMSILYLQHIHKRQDPLVYSNFSAMNRAQPNIADSYDTYDPPSVHESKLASLL